MLLQMRPPTSRAQPHTVIPAQAGIHPTCNYKCTHPPAHTALDNFASPVPFLRLEDEMETKKAYKSFRFKTDLVWKSPHRGVLSATGKVDVNVGSPPEFRGF